MTRLSKEGINYSFSNKSTFFGAFIIDLEFALFLDDEDDFVVTKEDLFIKIGDVDMSLLCYFVQQQDDELASDVFSLWKL